ncbi:MAG: radical SAM protein [Byssovorax sp.]
MSIAATPAWETRLAAWALRLASAPWARRLSLWIARFLLFFRALAPGALLQRAVLGFIRMEAACCRADSPHFKFLARHLARFERAGTFQRMRRFLREREPARAAAHLDAWLRIGALGSMRHELLGRRLGTPGVPPRLLVEAQLALSPGCDLACEGCYTAEDRGGKAPRREDMAFLIDEAVRCGAFVIHLIGKGEPFLSPAWARELIAVIAARPHVLFTLATHGMHIDEAMAERLGELGNLVLLVAVDGPEPLHDARRGEGSYRAVHDVLARLRRHHVVFGFTCMVSQKSHAALTSIDFLRAQAEAGCVVGVFSRYFPLASGGVSDLAMDDVTLAAYRRAFDEIQQEAPIPLLDLDDVEQHTGCHSRAGESVYIDGITGQVSPCVRVPFAPAECRIDRDRGPELAAVLAHPFFAEYRRKEASCPSWCGANLDAELDKVSALLAAHALRPARLDAYQDRSREAARPVRRLPLLTTTDMRP